MSRFFGVLILIRDTMKYFFQFLLVCGLIAGSASTLQAGFDTSSCIQISQVEIECLGMDNSGFVTYRVNFKFSFVKAGTNFIRIHEPGTAGTTHTYPFKLARQSVTGKRYFWDLWDDPVCFTIDVYDVLPNGKVVKCSVNYCVWINCGGFDFRTTPPTDGSAPSSSAIAGETAESNASYVALAPNPAVDAVDVLVDVPSYDPASSLDIVDLNGNVVMTLATGMAKGEMVIPTQLNNVASGTYMVRMLHGGGSIVTPLQVIK